MASFEQAEEVSKRCFGHDGFRTEQERTIMGKRDVLAVMSTGAGKSLIQQLPTVALGGHYRFITSQGDTAPKPLKQNPHCKGTFSLTDFDV